MTISQRDSREPRNWPTYVALALLVGSLYMVVQHGRAGMAAQDLQRASFELPVERLPSTLVSISSALQPLNLPGKIGFVVSVLAPAVQTWSMVETKDWIFLSGDFASRTCPLLATYAKANPVFSPWSSEQVSIIETAYRGKPIALQGFVPRFKTVPARLGSCAGYSFDAKRGLLTMGERPVALLSADQSTLTP